MKHRIIVAGGREFANYSALKEELDFLLEGTEATIISGGARGVDSMGERYARENNIPVEIFPAQWDVYGKSAGYRRNVEMAENATALIAFWDGNSKGTKHMINIANQKGLLVHVANYQ